MRTAHVIHDRSDSHNVRSAVLPELLLQLLAGRRAASRQLLRENSTVDVRSRYGRSRRFYPLSDSKLGIEAHLNKLISNAVRETAS